MKDAWRWVLVILGTGLVPALAAQEIPGGAGKAQEPPKDAVTQAMEEELKSRLRRDNWMVTIERRGAKIEEIVEDFRRQVRINFVLDATNIEEGFLVDEFIVRDVPFREAFLAFLDKAKLMIDEETADLIRISHPPRVTFNFKNAQFNSVIDNIARIAGASVIVSGEIKGAISGNLHDIPWFEALDSVAKTHGAATVRENFDVIRVIPAAQLVQQMETRVFPLKYILMPSTFRANIESGKFVFGAHPTPPKKEKERLEGFHLLPTLEAVLTRNLSSDKPLGKLNFDPQTNAFVVTDVKPVLDRVEQILKVLDVEPPQAIVDVKFISTTNEDLLSFGINYSFAATGNDGITVRTTPQDPRIVNEFSNKLGTQTTLNGVGGKVSVLPFGLGHEAVNSRQYWLSEYDMLTTFRAFKKDKYSRLIQEPTLSAVDNELATIFIGEEIRYAVSEAESTTSGGLVFTITEAKGSPVRIGFQLMLLPRIIKETNKVLLTVIPQNELLSGTTSALTGFERFTLTGAGAGGADVGIDLPRITAQTIVSRMLLESGRTAVLGGMVIDRATLEDKKVPVLGDLPIIGYFFKQSNDTSKKEHLLIFVTPRIVRPDTDRERLENLFRERQDALRREFESMQPKPATPEAPAEQK